MNKILTENEITKFKEDGAIFLKNKFDINWINKLKKGIEINIPKDKVKVGKILPYSSRCFFAYRFKEYIDIRANISE